MSELKKKNKLARLEATITYFIYHKGKNQSCYICKKKLLENLIVKHCIDFFSIIDFK